MRTYSMDLRERVVAAYAQGDLTLAEVAARFRVSVAWVKRLRQRLKATGSLDPLPGGRGPEPKLGEDQRRRLAELVRADPDATLAELRQRLAEPVSRSTVCRALAALGLTYKKSPSTPASATAPTSPPAGRSSSARSRRWTPPA
jgi:transposase